MTTVNQTGIISQTANKKKELDPKVISKRKLYNFLEEHQEEINRALPATMDKGRFMRIAFTALDKTPNLYLCSEASFYGAIITCAQLGLEPNTPLGLAFLTPYNNTRKAKALGVEKFYECQFQIGYQGILALAYRTQEYEPIYAHEVYENDFFDYELGLEPFLKHKPAKTNRGKLTHVYACYHLKNGGKSFTVASTEDVLQHAKKYSKTYDSKSDSFNGPWQSEFGEMAKKTACIQLLKYAPKSIELALAQSSDNKVLEASPNGITYVDEETGEVKEMTEIQEGNGNNE